LGWRYIFYLIVIITGSLGILGFIDDNNQVEDVSPAQRRGQETTKDETGTEAQGSRGSIVSSLDLWESWALSSSQAMFLPKRSMKEWTTLAQ
jgi:hypothetical protein